jgi:hypothetical protein
MLNSLAWNRRDQSAQEIALDLPPPCSSVGGKGRLVAGQVHMIPSIAILKLSHIWLMVENRCMHALRLCSCSME